MAKKQNEAMIFGIRAIIETIKAGRDLEKVFVQKNLSGDLAKELNPLLRDAKAPVVKVPAERLKKFTTKNHQGVVAFVSPVKYYKLPELVSRTFESGEQPFFLVLDQLTDVRNFGAIARTALCSGVHGIIIPFKGAAQVNGESVKTSAGALNSIPVCREFKLMEGVRYLKESGISIFGCSEKGEKNIQTFSFNQPTALIMGSEESGISKEILELCDEVVKIPIKGTISSLNVSAATAMACYEVLRQRF